MSGVTGDNTYRASGVVAAAGGGTSWQAVETGTSFTAAAGKGYPVNTTSNACTVTLPTGTVGDVIEFVDYAATWDTNGLTLTSSDKIEGSNDDKIAEYERQGIKVVYVDATQGWLVVTGVNETRPALGDPPYTIEWLVIAGGASGATGWRSGGGGAGGYRNSYASEQSGKLSTGETPWTGNNPGDGAITVTVGGGAQSPSADLPGVAGSTSSIAATGHTTVSSYGGGGGGTHAAGTPPTGTFGCGGGGGDQDAPGYTGSAGTAGQGFDGGDCIWSGPPSDSRGAGGGGSGEIGQNNEETPPISPPMGGGDGMASAITGASVLRCGGGGGGDQGPGDTQAAGGTGGGGTGGNYTAPFNYPTSGAPTGSPAFNSGAGGGGAASNAGSNGEGDGDDGIVILRMPTSGYSTTTSGSPTVITDGDDTVLVFEGDGTYTR